MLHLSQQFTLCIGQDRAWGITYATYASYYVFPTNPHIVQDMLVFYCLELYMGCNKVCLHLISLSCTNHIVQTMINAVLMFLARVIVLHLPKLTYWSMII